MVVRVVPPSASALGTALGLLAERRHGVTGEVCPARRPQGRRSQGYNLVPRFSFLGFSSFVFSQKLIFEIDHPRLINIIKNIQTLIFQEIILRTRRALSML